MLEDPGMRQATTILRKNTRTHRLRSRSTKLALEVGEELNKEDKDDLDLQKSHCVEAVGHMKTCASNAYSSS